MGERFSERYGFRAPEAPIQVRYDAPQKLRGAIPVIARQAGLPPSVQRTVICNILRTPENRDNWSEYPNIWHEVLELMESCHWWQVYDIAEALYDTLCKTRFWDLVEPSPEALRKKPPVFFVEELNEVFRENGIGWQMTDKGKIEFRGDQYFTEAHAQAVQALAQRSMPKTEHELRMAFEALSRRPKANVTGAVHHATNALESVVRRLLGTKETLGQAAKDIPDIHPALIAAIEKLYGYASAYEGGGRHGSEALQVNVQEAQLVFHVCAALISYLCEKFGLSNDQLQT